MYDQAIIDGWLSLYTRRLPGEGVFDAVLRLLHERALTLFTTLDLLDPWRWERGRKAAGIFLPTGTRLRAGCPRCKRSVDALIIPEGVSVGGLVATSVEGARRVAIDAMGCHDHTRGKHGVFWGRRVIDFWEVWHRGEWRRLSYFRLPGDDGRHPI